ncbi:MAG: GMP synthase (glutamine-hydrolyzing), partial [Spirosomataceae bacterium]
MSQELVLIIDFGSQYTQLIARRVRELNIYCEIHPFYAIPEINDQVKAVILSGSPCSVLDAESPKIDFDSFKGKLPVLGVCYGAQLLANEFGGKVAASSTREYGRTNLSSITSASDLFDGLEVSSQVWMSHGDTIVELPANAELLASTSSVKVAAYKIKNEETYGIQFHPEVTHSTDGKKVLNNFLVNIARCVQDWTAESFVETSVAELKETLGNDKVVMGLSGGVDSTVAATLIHQAIGKKLYCIFVDNGLLRKNEFEEVLDSYKGMGLNVKGVNSSQRFYDALKGLKDPELKRKAIGKTFIDVFDEEAKLIKD